MKPVNKKAEYQREYRKTKRGHLVNALGNLRTRAKNQNIPCDITLEYLESIAGDECPIFKTPFIWGQGNAATDQTPSLDKVIPELGYIKHNIVFISFKANKIKQDVTEKELYAVADWLHEKRKEVLNVKTQSTTPVSEGDHFPSAVGAELGSFSTTGFGEKCDNAHHHSGAVQGQDADHSTQASSGDGVGHRGKEVGTLIALTRLENHGEPEPEIVRLDFGRRHLSD